MHPVPGTKNNCNLYFKFRMIKKLHRSVWLNLRIFALKYTG